MTNAQRSTLLPRVHSVGTALPRNYLNQQTLTAALHEYWASKGANLDGFDRLHRATRVSGRYLALPMHEYLELDTFASSNGAWLRVAPALGAQAASHALESAGLRPADVNHFFLVNGTGIATPSIDARIANALGMTANVKRTPIFGLGCAGGAAGIARAADYLRAFPDEVAIVVAVELCSLTLQRSDLSMANMIASGLFGDGAAAVVLSGGERNDCGGPRVIASRSVLFPDTESVMGWEITDSGFKIVMSPEIPNIARRHLSPIVDPFLAEHQLARSDILHWIAHTGGPKVLRSIEEGLELPTNALKRSWDSLDQMGNLSSAAVLFVLADFLNARHARRNDYGMIIALGPGFCAELVLIRW
jgi:alkylresorcinol/alkylpyrone synthase